MYLIQNSKSLNTFIVRWGPRLEISELRTAEIGGDHEAVLLGQWYMLQVKELLYVPYCTPLMTRIQGCVGGSITNITCATDIATVDPVHFVFFVTTNIAAMTGSTTRSPLKRTSPLNLTSAGGGHGYPRHRGRGLAAPRLQCPVGRWRGDNCCLRSPPYVRQRNARWRRKGSARGMRFDVGGLLCRGAAQARTPSSVITPKERRSRTARLDHHEQSTHVPFSG